MKMLHYGKRGMHIYRDSSWYEIDRGLLQVTRLKLRILAVQLLILSTPSQFVNSISGEHILIKFQTNKNLFFSQLSSCGVKLIAYYHR